MDMNVIIRHISDLFAVSFESIVYGARGQQNMPYWISMYLCQEIGDHRLIDIAHKFNLRCTGSIPGNIAKAKEIIEADNELKNKISQYFT
jgi:chromosomal replication initiation ATPase DnaA